MKDVATSLDCNAAFAEGYRAGAEAMRRSVERMHLDEAAEHHKFAVYRDGVPDNGAAISEIACRNRAERILALPVPEALAPIAPAVNVAEVLAALEPIIDLVEDYGPFHDREAIMAGRIRARRGEDDTPPRLTYAHLLALAALAAKMKETPRG